MKSYYRTRKCLRFGIGTLLLMMSCVCGYFGGQRIGFEEGLRGGLDARLVTRQYQVADLATLTGLPVPTVEFDSLIELIQADVAPETWAANGPGAGKIEVYPQALSLFITQTSGVHEEVEQLLAKLRSLQPQIAWQLREPSSPSSAP